MLKYISDLLELVLQTPLLTCMCCVSAFLSFRHFLSSLFFASSGHYSSGIGWMHDNHSYQHGTYATLAHPQLAA